jgi:peptide/nickel transport system permease protein
MLGWILASRCVEMNRGPSFAWRFSRNRAALFGFVILSVVVVMALSAHVLFPGDPWDMVGQPLLRPGADSQFLFGTDALGRDVAAGIFHGARVSLFIGAAASAISVLIGTVIGAFSGYFPGWIDELLSRMTELFQTMPFFVFALVIVAIIGPSVNTIVFAIGVVTWPPVARLVRAEFLSLRSREFVEASISQGSTNLQIIFRQILPNATAPIVVTASVKVATAILTESSLAFLGLGDPNVISWGTMIGSSRDMLSLVGDGINDALNPRSRDF